MIWLLSAVAGHLLNAVAFILDKTLLRSAFKTSATYATLISLLSGVVLLAAPWVRAWPNADVWPSVIGFGGLQVVALWTFFEALRRGEASRVVPLVGVLVALFAFFESAMFLGEHLTWSQIGGFGLLVIATAILAGGGEARSRLSSAAIFSAIASAFLFASSSVSGKAAFDRADFLAVFVGSRAITLFGGLVLFALVREARREIVSIVRPRNGNGVPRGAAPLAVVAQTCGAAGYVLVNYAVSLGSASLVNAMQAVQYAAIVMVAWFGGESLRLRLGEAISPSIVIAKTVAIVFVAIGLFLVATP